MKTPILIRAWVLWLIGAALSACTAPAILTPKTGPGTEWPCGVDEYRCPKSALCCSSVEACQPPSPGYPVGVCEFVGGARPDAGAP